MNAMWSRAVQVQSSCHCRLCLNTAHTLARRFTTAASRRKSIAADFFTAWYTTILGTAAIIDAQRKVAKRKELDEKLENAKAALNTSGIQEGPLDEQLENNDGSFGSASNGIKNRYALRRKNEKNTSLLIQELASLCGITRSPSGRSSWMQNKIDWVRVEAAIVAEENDPTDVLREPKSAEQLGLTTDTINQLVDGLLVQDYTRRNGSGQGGEGASKQLTKAEESIMNELEEIRSGLYYPSYEMPVSDLIRSRSTRSLLSESIRRIFNKAYSSTEVVGKVCYNLLTSCYPPTIHTYNALIAGFNRIERPDLAQVVVDSYIHNTTWPATQQTMVCLLNHYRGKNDVQGLRDVIARMRGVKDTGLHFSIISRHKIYSEEWLSWASTQCASRKYAVVERAHRGSDVFDAIIKGWLHHRNLSAASTIFVACIRNDSWIPTQTLYQFFTACLGAVDHCAARQIVRGIVKNLRKFVVMLDRTLRHTNSEMSLRLIDSLSNLIRICGLPLYSASSVVDVAHVQSIRTLEYLVSTAKIQLELHASAQLCSKVLETVESAGSLLSRLEGAVRIVNASQWNRKAFENYYTVARLLSIEKRFQDLERKGKALANQAKSIIIKIATGLDLDPAFLLFSDPPKDHHRQQEFLALSHALEYVELDGDSLTQNHIKAQLVRGIPNPHLARRLRLVGQLENMCPKVLLSFYRPGAVTFDRPDNRHYSRSIREAERKLLDSEDFIKAILFSYLGVERQKRLRVLYPKWYAMPLEPLIDYHMRRKARGRKGEQPADEYAVIDAQRGDVHARPTQARPTPAVGRWLHRLRRLLAWLWMSRVR